MSDTDMLETGRALSDMMAREMTGIRPTQISNTVNFYVEIPQPGETVYTPPLYQALPGTNAPTNPQLRTNRLETFYFLTHPNQAWPDQAWVANGYYIVPDNAGVGIGSLYRYSNTNIQGLTTYGLPVLAPARNLFTGFANALSQLRTDQTPSPAGGGTVSHIADGIVHMSLRVFATNGFPIRGTGGLCAYWLDPYAGTYRAIGQTTNRFSLFTPDNWVSQTFYSNAVPAYVELELGVLDPQSYQRYKGIDASVPSGQVQFLSNRVAQVHIFRQRIPIRNVDPTAY